MSCQLLLTLIRWQCSILLCPASPLALPNIVSNQSMIMAPSKLTLRCMMLLVQSVPSMSGAPSFRGKRPPKEAELDEQLTTKRHPSAGRFSMTVMLLMRRQPLVHQPQPQSIIQQHGPASCQLQPGTLRTTAQRQTGGAGAGIPGCRPTACCMTSARLVTNPCK